MDTLSVMDEELRSLMDRLRDEAAGSAAYDLLVATDDNEVLARVLVEPGRPLWAREIAAFRLGCAGDRRAFEALVLLLNHRDPERCVSAAHALARLDDPRTPRAAAALATNTLRTAYALHPVRLLTTLRAPEAVPALVATLQRLLAPGSRTGGWRWPAWRGSDSSATTGPARSSRRPSRTPGWGRRRRRRWGGCRRGPVVR
ncbi:hypothetical protein Smic_69940 [Streptomyces microflavus]|uniref:Adenylosuccinate lyase n=1 Tax=Streptomyces microflavus TaxID=1919 RepID=A0A7J0D175_STRMI|nr:hypothetical protein Smic_69940 [Streptomyces microflavus]